MNKSEPVVNAASLFKHTFGDTITITNIDELTKGSTEIENYNECVHVQDCINKDTPEELTKIISACTLTPYDYQIDTVKMLRQLELDNKSRTTTTNGVLVKLPIGSGKSLVYELLTLAFPSVPCNPIITSTNGTSIDLDNQLSIVKYPFFYEKVCYEDSDPVAVGLTNYTQLPVTVLLTHSHLLEQAITYFYNDFPVLKKNDDIYHRYNSIKARLTAENPKVNPAQITQATLNMCGIKSEPKLFISVAQSVKNLNLNAKIWIVVAESENINYIRLMSQNKPFARIIIDDFTSMRELGDFRQIYASSNIFISGSGWNRSKDNIPISYYALRDIKDANITLVDDPVRTLKGIRRDTILSLEMETADNSFNEYGFVSDVESETSALFNGKTPMEVYKPIKDNPHLCSYLDFKFLLNFSQMLGKNLNSIQEDVKSGKLSDKAVTFCLQLIERIKTNSPLLWNKMIVDGQINRLDAVRPIISDNSCFICKSTAETHHSYGMVMKCCGAFVCANCLRIATTNKLHYDGSTHYSNSYYCACCQYKEPKMMMCTTKDATDERKHIAPLIKDNFDITELGKPHIELDYYCYGVVNGFVPLYHDGAILTRLSKDNEPLLMQSRAQLGLMALRAACAAFVENGIKASSDSHILIYGAPTELTNRIKGYYNNIIKTQVYNKAQCPSLMFKKGVKDLIGLHCNIPIIIKWDTVTNKDELHQLIGRIVRLSNFDNRLYIYADLAPENA